jgi:hypothetical protein
MAVPQLLPVDDPDLQHLVEDLEYARAASYPLELLVARTATAGDDPFPVLDSLAAALEFRGLGADWIEIPRRIATKLVQHLIGGELAYPVEVVPDEAAAALAQRFLELFGTGARYFTNGACSGAFRIYDLAGEEVLGWRSLSDAPFDNGVAVIGHERVGMIWAEDAP